MADVTGLLEIGYVEKSIRDAFFERNRGRLLALGEDFDKLSQEARIKETSTDRYDAIDTTHSLLSLAGAETEDRREEEIEGYAVRVDRGRVFKVGRSNQCDICVSHPATSLEHFFIWSILFDLDSKPITYLKDNSLNGVLINGVRLQKHETTILNDGDKIEIRQSISMCFHSFSQDLCGSTQAPVPPRRSISQWYISNDILGYGSFGAVYVAHRHGDTRSLFAVKIIRTPKTEPSCLASSAKSKNEADLLTLVEHPNVIKFHEAVLDGGYLYLFEDLVCGGDLFSYLSNGDCLSPILEKETIVIVYQILQALDFLHHKLGVIHRDLKLDNVLMKAPVPYTKIILCDFGIAKSLSCSQRARTVVGTVEYGAPEIFSSQILSHYQRSHITPSELQGYGFKCDMWSLGIMIHIMLTGISPFYCGNNEADTIKQATLGKLDFSSVQWNNVSLTAKKFISHLIQVNPENRFDTRACFKHSWISQNRDYLERIYEQILTK